MSALSNSWNRHRRWFVLALVLACFGGIVFIRAIRRAERAERLVAEINQTDGYVKLGMSVWERIEQIVQGHATDCGTLIKLPSDVDLQWFASRSYLADLPLGNVQVDDGAGRGAWLAPLVARHPIAILYARGATGTDEIAAALSEKNTLLNLHLPLSDLTDAGLQKLPLEQVEMLDISNTQVTAAGLRELHRALQLRTLYLGRRQINAEILSPLDQITHPYSLILVGEDVTDATLEMLIVALEHSPANALDRIFLDRTSISSAGVDAWKSAGLTIPIEQ